MSSLCVEASAPHAVVTCAPPVAVRHVSDENYSYINIADRGSNERNPRKITNPGAPLVLLFARGPVAGPRAHDA